jgi:hypothetical protein
MNKDKALRPLNTQHQLAIKMMMEGKRDKDICMSLDIAPSTLYEWKQRKDFREILDANIRDVLNETRSLLVSGYSHSLKVFHGKAIDEEEPAAQAFFLKAMLELMSKGSINFEDITKDARLKPRTELDFKIADIYNELIDSEDPKFRVRRAMEVLDLSIKNCSDPQLQQLKEEIEEEETLKINKLADKYNTGLEPSALETGKYQNVDGRVKWVEQAKMAQGLPALGKDEMQAE